MLKVSVFEPRAARPNPFQETHNVSAWLHPHVLPGAVVPLVVAVKVLVFRDPLVPPSFKRLAFKSKTMSPCQQNPI